MISILTTVKNGHEFLEECANSIFLQETQYGEIHVEWEWWIGINGHGPSGGPALEEALRIQKLGGNRAIHVINMPEADSRVAALNTLCSKTNGEWIAIIDCDDTWKPEKLITQKIALSMSLRPIDVIGTHCIYTGDMTGSPRLPSGWITPEIVMHSNPLINSSVLIRKELAVWEDRCGLEDYDLWIRLAMKGYSLFNVPHPLVCHRIHKGSAFNAGAKQDVDGLRTIYAGPPPTVITAYYPIRSKFDVNQYVQWITGFWPLLPCCLVFYTEPGLVPFFTKVFSSRKNTIVRGIPLESLSAFNKLSYRTWKETESLDKEKNHAPELYALWYEKKEFVLRTITTNPFSSDRFVWCDAGIGRHPEWIAKLQRFPIRSLIPSEKMVVLQIDALNVDDCSIDEWGIPGRFDSVATFGGGILASGIEGWKRWSKAYDAMLIRYHLAGRFIGKDQNIIASMIIETPSLAAVVKRPSTLGPINGWFYLLLFLGGNQPL
jgi:glycosyltransferase involved in cell wall biosynthesis